MEHTGNVNNIISVKNIQKTFYGKGTENEVIADISLDVKENEFVVLFGPAQCGKTTLINLIAGLENVSSGEVRMGDDIVSRPGPDRGVVYQKTALFPWLSVEGNVQYGPKVCGKTKEEQKRISQKYIKLVGLEGFEKAYPVKLSGGMRQRVGIARAYANDPKVLLMDEPFGHLDAQTRYMMEQELERIWQSEKRTVIFVTNNIEEALYLADRIILLTNCPTRIAREYKIDMPRPRSYVDETFLRLRKQITDDMEKSF